MPKATRAKDEKETPKKRSREATPANGNGADAVEPVTTAPAIAATTSELSTGKVTPKKRASKTKPVSAIAADPVAPAIAETTAEVTVGKVSAPATAQNVPVPEELVRRRAYELYLQRRGKGGSPEQDWFQALQEISAQYVA